MASYYTYGMVPDVDETVYGTSVDYAGLGFPEYADRGLPQEEPVGPPPLSLVDDEGLTPAPEPEPSVEMFNWPDGTRRPYPPPPEISGLAPAPQGPSGLGSVPSQQLPVAPPAIQPPVVQAPANLFVEGADVPQSGGLNIGALDELFANLRKNEELQKLALEPGLLQQGFTGTSGVTAPPSGAGIFATPTAPTQPAVDFNVTPEMAGALQQVARPAEITTAEREAVTSNPRVQALQQISDQLKANDFAGAFDTALAAERNLGGDFVGNIIDSNKLRELRGPMTADEIVKFYNEMPENVFTERYLGPGNEFKKEQAIERNIAALGGQAGYVDPMLGVKKEETLLSKLPIEEMAALAALAMGATAIPGLLGGASGGAGAGAAGGTAGGAGAAAGGAGALTGVVPTGLIPGAVSAAGLGTATFPIIAGSGLTAAQIAALGLGAAGAAGAASGGAGAAPNAPTPEPPLEEVVVTGTRPPVIPPAAVVGGLAGTGAVATQPPVVEPPLEEVVVEAKKPVEPEISVPPPIAPPSAPVEPVAPEAPLEEVTVQAKKPVEPPVVVPPPVVPTTTPATPTVPEGPLEEVVVEAKKPVEPELSVPPPVLPPAPPTAPAAPEAPLEEVTVQAKRPTEPPIVVPPVTPTPTSPIDTAFPEGPVEEVVVETTKPTPEKPIIPPVVVPTTTPVDIPKEPTKINQPENPLKALLDKYGSLENFLKLLGALGSAASSTKGTTAPTSGIGAGGMGGALPKYTMTRKQLSPDIDYYTYGTRPEAKFFEYGLQLEKPTQPELPPAKPPVEEPVMAQGGLMGYSKGGSNQPRYFDGPGSGRDDKIPALLSDGEYVMDAETLALLGDGSTKEGARRMDEFRAKIRAHKGRALSRGQISPDAKSPTEYMGGGLA